MRRLHVQSLLQLMQVFVELTTEIGQPVVIGRLQGQRQGFSSRGQDGKRSGGASAPTHGCTAGVGFRQTQQFATQGVGIGIGDAHVHETADQLGAGGEVDLAVVLGAAEQLFGILAGRTPLYNSGMKRFPECRTTPSALGTPHALRFRDAPRICSYF